MFQSFTSQLSEEISKTPVKTEKGKSRLARDVAYFTRRLKALHHVDPPSDSVMEAVDHITIASRSPKQNDVSPVNSNSPTQTLAPTS